MKFDLKRGGVEGGAEVKMEDGERKERQERKRRILS